jgi:hypothetical protein
MPSVRNPTAGLDLNFPATGLMHVSKSKMPAGKGPVLSFMGFLVRIAATLRFDHWYLPFDLAQGG